MQHCDQNNQKQKNGYGKPQSLRSVHGIKGFYFLSKSISIIHTLICQLAFNATVISTNIVVSVCHIN
jgi:hypothetical protein